MVKPLGDRVLVEPIKEESTTSFGLVLPDTAQGNGAVARARVLSVGDGRYENGNLVPVSVVSGDEVYMSKYGGLDVEVDGKDCIIVSERDLIAVEA